MDIRNDDICGGYTRELDLLGPRKCAWKASALRILAFGLIKLCRIFYVIVIKSPSRLSSPIARGKEESQNTRMRGLTFNPIIR